MAAARTAAAGPRILPLSRPPRPAPAPDPGPVRTGQDHGGWLARSGAPPRTSGGRQAWLPCHGSAWRDSAFGEEGTSGEARSLRRGEGARAQAWQPGPSAGSCGGGRPARRPGSLPVRHRDGNVPASPAPAPARAGLPGGSVPWPADSGDGSGSPTADPAGSAARP